MDDFNDDDNNNVEFYEDDINHLEYAELQEFEQWLDEVNKYNDLVDFGVFP